MGKIDVLQLEPTGIASPDYLTGGAAHTNGTCAVSTSKVSTGVSRRQQKVTVTVAAGYLVLMCCRQSGDPMRLEYLPYLCRTNIGSEKH
jgi:hypothetical protein